MEPTIIEPTKSKAKSIFYKVLIAVVLISVFAFYWKFYNVYSDGERVGLLTKVSHKGNVFKTYEGEMLIGNITQNNSGLVNEKFVFSIANEKIADTLSKLQGQRVSLHYKQYRGTLPWRGDSQYIIVEIAK